MHLLKFYRFGDEILVLLPNYFRSLLEARDEVPFTIGDRSIDSALANVTLPTDMYIDSNYNNALCLVVHRLLEVKVSKWENRIESFTKWVNNCKIDYTKTSRDGSTVFHMLATRRHDRSIDILKAILAVDELLHQDRRSSFGKSSSNTSALNILRASDSKSALSLAIDNGFIDVASLLIKYGASYNENGLLAEKYDKMNEWMGFVEELFSNKLKASHDNDITDLFTPFNAPGVSVAVDDPSFTIHYTSANEKNIFEFIKALYKSLAALEDAYAGNSSNNNSDFANELAVTYVRFGVTCVRYPDMFNKIELENILNKYFALITAHSNVFNHQIHPCMLSVMAHYYQTQSDGGNVRCKPLLQDLQKLCNNVGIELNPRDNELKIQIETTDFVNYKNKLFNTEKHRHNKLKMDKYKQFIHSLRMVPASVPVVNGVVPVLMSEKNIQIFESILLDKVGIENIKNLVISTYTSSIINQKLKNNYRNNEIVNGNYHYIFAGNPGTGKTTIAKAFAKILAICGVRTDTFQQYTGTELLHMGSSKFLNVIEQMRGSRSRGGPSYEDLPKERFLEQEIVEINCNGVWYEAEIRKEN